MKHLFIVLLVVVAGFYTTSVAGTADEAGIRNVKDFNAIKVSAGIDLFVSMGNEETVKVVAGEDIIDDVITEVKGGTLHIYMKKRNWFNIFNWGAAKPREVFVTATTLERLDASSGSDVKSENTLKGDRLEANASSGSNMNIDLVYKEVSFDSSSGADVKITGKAKTFNASASSGSDINARGFETAVCHARVSSGADISVYVTGEIYAKASSGGDIRYFGNPGLKNIEESSGGDVAAR